ncbi:MAG: helix-turn-helix domain-containing protein [Paracoccaceae bacterium]
MEIDIVPRLTTLGHPHRLAVFRLLMRRYPDNLPAQEIAGALTLKPSTLSAYLSALLQAGLITQERVGTSLLYAIDMQGVRETMDMLFLDCCRGRPDLCASLPPNHEATLMPNRPWNVLFICTGNSARSIFAESILRSLGDDRFRAFSAGTNPHSTLNPFAVDLLQAKGHDITPLRSKTLAEFSAPGAPVMDFIFTVCDQAANESCPAWDGQPIIGHWGVPDPVKAEGTPAQKGLAFQRAYGDLHRRISTFIALPVETLDRMALQSAVDNIGRMTPKE